MQNGVSSSNIYGTMFGSLPLFSCLVPSRLPLSNVVPMYPNKVKFVHDPYPVQAVHSGMYFVIPDLSINEKMLLERAILDTAYSAVRNTVLNVPEYLARKFDKSVKGYPGFNELVFRYNKLMYVEKVKCLITNSSEPVDLMESNVGIVASVDYAAVLCQGLLCVARHYHSLEVEAVKEDIRRIRSCLRLTDKPSVGFKDKDVITVLSPDFVYSTEDDEFVNDLCTLMYNFYDPYTEVSKYMAWT